MDTPKENGESDLQSELDEAALFATIDNPEEEARILKALERKNKLRIFVPLGLVILLSYLLFGGPLKKTASAPDTNEAPSKTSD